MSFELKRLLASLVITPLLDVTGWCYDHRSLSPPSWVSVSYYPGLNLSCESSEKTFKSTEHTNSEMYSWKFRTFKLQSTKALYGRQLHPKSHKTHKFLIAVSLLLNVVSENVEDLFIDNRQSRWAYSALLIPCPCHWGWDHRLRPRCWWHSSMMTTLTRSSPPAASAWPSTPRSIVTTQVSLTSILSSWPFIN